MKDTNRFERSLHRCDLIKGVAAAGLGLAALAFCPSAVFAEANVSKNGKQNLIQNENAKPGTRDWLLTQFYNTAEPTSQHPEPKS